MTLVGAAVMLLGLVMLVLADIPRRVLRRLAYQRRGQWRSRVAGSSQAMTKSVRQDVAWGTGWFLGR